MREILFRGKRTDNGEWVEGSFCLDAIEQIYGIERGVDGFIRRFIPAERRTYMYEVERETVGQYTGLDDRNGTKIFEGDIVAGTAYSSEWIGVIVWIDEIATFGVRYSHRTDPTAWEKSSILKAISNDRHDKFAAQIIGNIYNNPELLEVKQNEM